MTADASDVMVERRPKHRAPRRRRRVIPAWPLLIAIVLTVGAAGTFLAYAEADNSTSSVHFAVFWVAQLVTLITLVGVGMRVPLSRSSRMVLLASYALFNYLPKLIMSPRHATYFDEFGHWRQVQAIVATGNLRPDNAYQPIIRDFPGLELVTVGVHEVTRLPTWHSAQIVIGVAHVATLLVVFGIARALALSDRLAMLAALVYSTNPSFQYFETQFSYESLGLTLALGVILCALRARNSSTVAGAWRWVTAGCALAAACAVTHHLSSAFMVFSVILVVVFVKPAAGNDDVIRSQRRGGWVLAGWSVVAVAVWIGVFARPTLSYLEPHVRPAFAQLAELLGIRHRTGTSGRASGSGGGRVIFAGSLSPQYEIYSAYASPFVALLAVAVAAVGLWCGRQGSVARRLLPAIILAVLYFASLPFTLTAAGSEGAHRSWAFSYLGVAIMAAYGAGWLSGILKRRPRAYTWAGVVGTVAVVIVAVGGVTLGENVYYRFPGPYDFGTDNRSLTSEAVAVARWADAHLSPGSHVVTDRFTGEAVEGFSDLQVVSPNESAAFELYKQAGHPSPTLRGFLRKHDFAYFILDTRILTELPNQRLFSTYAGPASINARGLAEFTATGFSKLVYRSQHYRIYSLSP